jgi:hypothetical protein
VCGTDLGIPSLSLNYCASVHQAVPSMLWKKGFSNPGFVFCPALRLHILFSTHWACGVDASAEKEKLLRQVSIGTHSKLCQTGPLWLSLVAQR